MKKKIVKRKVHRLADHRLADHRLADQNVADQRDAEVSAFLVRDFMTDAVDIASPDMSLADCAAKMRNGDFGALPIGEEDRLIGMITDRDITIRAVAQGMDPVLTKAWEVMTERVLYCYDDQSIIEVAHNMGDNQVKRLLVLNRDKRLVGILSLGDIAQSRSHAREARQALSEITAHTHREPRNQAAA